MRNIKHFFQSCLSCRETILDILFSLFKIKNRIWKIASRQDKQNLLTAYASIEPNNDNLDQFSYSLCVLCILCVLCGELCTKVEKLS